MAVTKRLEVEGRLDSLGQIRDFITANVDGLGMSADKAGDLLLAVDEAASNIVMHGFDEVGKQGSIEVEITQQPDSVLVRLRDTAALFDPTKGQEASLDVSPLEREEAGGFGVYLIKHLVDRLTYRVTEDGRNELSIVKSHH